MKTLLVYYSRSGHTAKIAQELADALECDIEEIIDTKNRSGIIGWLRSGRDAMNQSLTLLKDPVNDPADYDLLVIGTPSGPSCIHLCQDLYTSKPGEIQPSGILSAQQVEITFTRNSTTWENLVENLQ